MKILFLSLSLLFGIFQAVSQNSCVGLSMGPSLPFRDFQRSTNYFNTGFAQPGFHLNFNGNYIPKRLLGFGGSFSFITNMTDDSTSKTIILAYIKDNQLAPVEFPEDAEINYSSGFWSSVGLMIGPTLTIPLDKFQFKLKSFVGLTIVYPPEKNLDVEYQPYIYKSFSDGQTVSFSYCLGAGLAYEIKKNYNLVLETIYEVSHPRFNTNSEFYDGEVFTSLPTISNNLKIETISIAAGISYVF